MDNQKLTPLSIALHSLKIRLTISLKLENRAYIGHVSSSQQKGEAWRAPIPCLEMCRFPLKYFFNFTEILRAVFDLKGTPY